MKIIDADTHVDESESTWAGLGEGYSHYMPVTVSPKDGAVNLNPSTNLPRNRWWLVEGRLQARAIRDDITHPPRERRELEDVPGRLRHMDEMGVDVQVIFPTFFIRYGTNNPEAEYALTTTYNRWLANKCEGTNGRLRWACVLPFLQPEKAAEELRWAKAHGACGIFKRGFDLERPVSDPQFFPVYEEASALDVPLCLHTGHPLPGHEGNRGFPIMSAVNSLMTSKIPDRFPKLRFGFIEAGASWIPYTVSQRAAQKRQQARRNPGQWLNAFDLEQSLFRDNRFFVTIDPVDDVEYILKFGTEDNLMIGTDYSHSDVSANLNAFAEVQEWADGGRITQTAAEKILETNAREFYGL
jgi:predicted TIM-barrel fold metal-dependent hydrolase